MAKEVGGWAALLDETGAVRHATRGARTDAVTADLTRLRTGRLPGYVPVADPVPVPGPGEEAHGHLEEGTHGPAEGGARGGIGHGAGEGGGVPRASEGGGQRSAGTRLPASLALSGPGEHIVVQPLGGGARPRGFFAVGANQPYSPVTHTVINAAGSLLTLAMEQGRTQLTAERRVRSAVLALLLAGAKEQAHAVLGPLGGRLPDEPMVVLATGAESLDALETHAFTALLDDADTGGRGDAARSAGAESAVGPMVVALVAEGMAGEVALEADGPVGISLPCGYDPAALRGAIDQAARALEATRSSGAPGFGKGSGAPSMGKGGGAPGNGKGRVVRFGELAGQGLLGLLDQPTAQAFAAALLAPLAAYGSRADLIESLHAYLGSNGHWDAAAQRLGVHRHTLRYRMKRAAELLGRDLDDPGVRAELWLALQAARR
ncbi:PucR family transcriptional regulator [Nonomuraea basaltis]|nr:PucR family transcriptional regulator [Nonomuraea basaltis]